MNHESNYFHHETKRLILRRLEDCFLVTHSLKGILQ